jgi:hypothetical protein
MSGVKAEIERWELIASSQMWFEEERLKQAPQVAPTFGAELVAIVATQG